MQTREIEGHWVGRLQEENGVETGPSRPARERWSGFVPCAGETKCGWRCSNTDRSGSRPLRSSFAPKLHRSPSAALLRTIAAGLATLSLVALVTILTPSPAMADSASIQVGDPTKDGTVEITIFIAKDEKGRHGQSVKVTVPVKGTWSATRKAAEIRKAIRKKIGKNGFTVDAGNDAVVRVRNDNIDWPIEITKTSDDTGEDDTTNSSFEGAPSSPPEDIAYQTRMKLTGIPTEGLITFGENDHVMTVPTAGLTLDQIYGVFQDFMGGVVQSDGLVLPSHTQSSAGPLDKSFTYEVTDPGLSIEVVQDRLFEYRDLIGGDSRLTVTNHGTLGFFDGSLETGSGFVYPAEGENHLYLGGVWLGLGPEEVLNRDFDADPSPDWNVSIDPIGAPQYDQLDNYAQALTTAFRARNAAGVDVVTRLTAATFDLRDDLDDFVLLTVHHESVGPSFLNGVFSGIFLDLDVLASAGSNFGSVHEGDGVIYLTATEPGAPFIGLAVARTGADCATELPVRLSFIRNSVYVWPEAHIEDVHKWGFLSGVAREYQITDAPEPDDYSVLASVGPFDLLPGDYRETQFILVGGSTLDDMLRNLEVAQSIVCDGGQLPSDAPEIPSVSSPSIALTAHPNPTVDATQLSYRLEQPELVTIEVFDSSGRRVRILEEGSQPTVSGDTRWDGLDDRGRIVPTGTYFARIRTAEGIATTRLTLIR